VRAWPAFQTIQAAFAALVADLELERVMRGMER
jgi:hypothetical protein